MNDQSKSFKILYTVFLVAVTLRAVVSLYDRFTPKEQSCDCKNNSNK